MVVKKQLCCGGNWRCDRCSESSFGQFLRRSGQQGQKSTAIHQSVTATLLIANVEEPFASSPPPHPLPPPQGQWSVAATIQLQNLGVKSTG